MSNKQCGMKIISFAIIFLVGYSFSLAQEQSADDLLKSIEVINPIETFGNEFDKMQVVSWKYADPKATEMLLTYERFEKDSLVYSDESKRDRSEEKMRDHDWNFIEKKILSKTAFTLAFSDAFYNDAKTTFLIKDDRLISTYSDRDSVSYVYLNNNLMEVHSFVKHLEYYDSSVQNVPEDLEDEEDGIQLSPVVEDAEAGLGSDDPETESPIVSIEPTRSIFYGYNKQGLVTSIRTLENPSGNNSSRVEYLRDEIQQFSYKDGLLSSFSEETKTQKTIDGLQKNNSLLYWSQNLKELTDSDRESQKGKSTTIISHDKTNKVDGFKILEILNGEERVKVSAQLFYKDDAVTKVEVVSENIRSTTDLHYDNNGFLVKSVESTYRDDELVLKIVQKRTFVYE